MKLLVHSNAPHCRTGYGVQVALLCDRLLADGHDVAVSCTYGQDGGVGTWISPTTRQPVVLYPRGYEPMASSDVLPYHAAHHFGGDLQDGWIIPLLDLWALKSPVLDQANVAAWCPVDHFPVPPGVLEFFQRTNATPIAMSRFGERLLFDAGLDPVYIPLAVDTKVYKPTPSIDTPVGPRTGRELLGIPDDAFVVGMVAMNKGWARDRKGFNEAIRAFGAFWKNHPEAILYIHAEQLGALEGINLTELATHAAVPAHALRWPDQYALRLGIPGEIMAATYSAFDVLLSPSHGEGFGVPVVEAQACGVPVIATNFSTGPELVGAGWLVAGQAEWDPAQHASYVVPFITDVLAKLELAYAADRGPMAADAVAFASQYDADRVFAECWQPFLASLAPQPAPVVAYDRSPMPDSDAVAVIVPAMREANMERLRSSFDATNDGTARLVEVWDDAEVTSYASKVNAGYARSTEPWVLLVGDDVEFRPGWIEAARKVSGDFDVIGTNDSEPGRVRNPAVAAGRHADHFFVRRSYVEADGGCLDGPGVLAPEVYGHWYVDKEMIGLARARGLFTPCLDSVVVHHHPGFEGREDLREADPTYMRAVSSSEADAKTWRSRLPLVEMQRVPGAKR